MWMAAQIQMVREVEVVLLTLDFNSIETMVRLNFLALNNEAKYEALIAGLLMSRELWVKRLRVQSDLNLIVNQMNDSYQVKDDRMLKYKELATES